MRKILKFSDEVATIEIVELEPQCRTLKISHCEDCASGKMYRTYYLSLPYIQFYFLRKKGERRCLFSASFNNKPFEIKEGNRAYMPSLPNCGPTVCMPSEVKTSASVGMQDLIESFFNSIFCERTNHDSEISMIMMTKLKSYSNWEEKTKKDPSFVADKSWWEVKAGSSGYTSDIITSLCKSHPPFEEFLKNEYNEKNPQVQRQSSVS